MGPAGYGAGGRACRSGRERRALPHLWLLVAILLTWAGPDGARAAQLADLGDTTVEWPHQNPEIEYLRVRSDIRFRFVRTEVTSQLSNSADVAKDAVFAVRMPTSAFITNFSMETGSKTYTGVIKERQEARREYGRVRSRGHNAAQLDAHRTVSRDLNQFRVFVSVAANSRVNFSLVYEELLARRDGVYQHVIDVSPGQIIRDLSVDVYVTESQPIKAVKVPPFRQSRWGTVEVNAENDLAHVQKSSAYSAHVSYKPSVRRQVQASPSGISGQFVMEYDVTREADAGEIQADGKYFVHFLAPSSLEPVPKNILFILDVSLSMAGTKLEQTKAAMNSILAQLRPRDQFNIIAFSTALRFWNRAGLLQATPTNVIKAKAFLQDMEASGGTNVNDALLRGIDMLAQSQSQAQAQAPGQVGGQEMRADMIIFLTDGEPTSGIVSTERILANVRQGNAGVCTIFSLGLGNGVDFGFLQKVALQNGGLARRIDPSDTARQLTAFYRDVASPLLTNVSISYQGDIAEDQSLSDTVFTNYYGGSDIVVAGRLKARPITTIASRVSAMGAKKPFSERVEVAVRQGDATRTEVLERLWAYVTIRRLLAATKEANNATVIGTAKTRALALSLQDHMAKVGVSGHLDGSRATAAGGLTSVVDNDPHFIVMVRGIEEGICFDIDGLPGSVYQLIYDPITGVVINGLVVGKPPDGTTPGTRRPRTYFGEIAVMRRGVNVTVTPDYIRVNGRRLKWRAFKQTTPGGARVVAAGKGNVTIELGPGLVFTVLRHKVHQPHPTKVDYLGLYMEDGSRLSKQTHGLIGQFQHQTVKFSERPRALDNGHMTALLRLRGPHIPEHEVEARLGRRRDMELRQHIPCWHVGRNGERLLQGGHSDYLVSHLYERSFSMARTLASSGLQLLL